jgi:hypothetical protein
MRGASPKRAKQQGTSGSHLVLGALVIVLLLIVSALARNAYKEGPVATPVPVPEVRHRAPAHRPAPPAEESDQVPLAGGTM